MERVIKLANFDITLKIEKPGIYSMGYDSSQGKSYLCSLLSLIKPEDIFVISSSDTEEVISKLNRFVSSNKDIVFIDRFDLVRSKEIEDLIKSLSNKIVLLDYKDFLCDKSFKASPASMWRDEKGFYIYA